MDIIKVAKTPGTIGPVIGGWEDARGGDGEGGKWPEVIKGGEGGYIDPTDTISQEDWFGGSGCKPVTGDIREGGDSEGYITDEDTTGLIDDGSGWVISGDWGFSGGWDASTEYGGRIGGGSSNIGGGTGGSGIILKVDGSSWFGGDSGYISGEGLLIGGVEESIDGGDDIGHTCPFVSPGFDGHTSTFGEKDFGVQPRT